MQKHIPCKDKKAAVATNIEEKFGTDSPKLLKVTYPFETCYPFT